MKHRSPAILAVVTTTLACLAPASTARQEFRPLGFLPDSIHICVAGPAVSADGLTVAASSCDAHGSWQAWRWTAGTGIASLGALPGGRTPSIAAAISADGFVIVGQAVDASDHGQAFRWTVNTGMVGLGALRPDIPDSDAIAVSADGSIVACNSIGFDAFGNNEWQPAIWTSSSGMTEMAPGISLGATTGMSSDGSVFIGETRSGACGPHQVPFRWSASGGLQCLPYPGTNGRGYAFPLAVSADGAVVVGNAMDEESYLGSGGFRWTAATGWTGGGDDYRQGLAASADGSIIVGSYLPPAGQPGASFIWTANSDILNLQAQLINDYGLNLDGWSLEQPTGISADGRTIVGNGRNPCGEYEPWIVRLDGPRRCAADFNCDDAVNVADFLAFLSAYAAGECRADRTHDGQINILDFLAFLHDYAAGCN
jgi:probable HAF family extracellular repeat protein